MRAVPLTPCRRHGKKRKEEDDSNSQANNTPKTKDSSGQTSSDLLQSSHVSKYLKSIRIFFLC